MVQVAVRLVGPRQLVSPLEVGPDALVQEVLLGAPLEVVQAGKHRVGGLAGEMEAGDLVLW